MSTQTSTADLLEAENDTIHGSASYKLGAGVTLAGTVGYVDLEDESDGNVGEDNDAWYVVVGPRLKF